MEQQTQSTKFQRKRKFMMVLPILILPFITLMFWALGGGKGEVAIAQSPLQRGFNINLPDAHLKEDRTLDKLSYYEKAASEAAKLKEVMKKDPHYNHDASFDLPNVSPDYYNENGPGNDARGEGIINTSTYEDASSIKSKEAKVFEKLEKLNTALNPPFGMQGQLEKDPLDHPTKTSESINKTDVDRLEEMIKVMGPGEGEDPELQQLSGMLEKILDIQHPDRVQEKLKQMSEKRRGQVFAVSLNSSNNPVSLLGKMDPSQGIESEYDAYSLGANRPYGFHSIKDKTFIMETSPAIEAVVHENQTLMSGATVMLRLVNDIYINGVLIPKDNFVYGMASLNGERLIIKIKSIRYENSIFPIDLSVYDRDGLNGIYVPGAISRDVAKQSTDRSIQGLGLTTFDPSLEVQAASAGIETAKSLLGKNVKLIKVTVKAGYQVLLLDEKQKLTN